MDEDKSLPKFKSDQYSLRPATNNAPLADRFPPESKTTSNIVPVTAHGLDQFPARQSIIDELNKRTDEILNDLCRRNSDLIVVKIPSTSTDGQRVGSANLTHRQQIADEADVIAFVDPQIEEQNAQTVEVGSCTAGLSLPKPTDRVSVLCQEFIKRDLERQWMREVKHYMRRKKGATGPSSDNGFDECELQEISQHVNMSELVDAASSSQIDSSRTEDEHDQVSLVAEYQVSDVGASTWPSSAERPQVVLRLRLTRPQVKRAQDASAAPSTSSTAMPKKPKLDDELVEIAPAKSPTMLRTLAVPQPPFVVSANFQAIFPQPPQPWAADPAHSPIGLKTTKPPINDLAQKMLVKSVLRMGLCFYRHSANVNYRHTAPLPADSTSWRQPTADQYNHAIAYEPAHAQRSSSSGDSYTSSLAQSTSSTSLDILELELQSSLVGASPVECGAPTLLYDTAIKSAVKKTHLFSRKIPWDRIFYLPTELCAAVETAAELALGVSVTYEGACDERWCKARCYRSGSSVCLHMYRCSCAQQSKSFGWCPHIHAATGCGRRKFFEDQMAFVPTTSKLMKQQHLRAKYKYMKLVKTKWSGNWPAKLKLAKVDGARPLKAAVATAAAAATTTALCRCPLYKTCKHCSACCCSYACKCSDYTRLRFPCEHSHFMAMCMRANPATWDFEANNFSRYEYHTDDSDEQTDCESYSIIEEHHQRSYGIKRTQIRPSESSNCWIVTSSSRCISLYQQQQQQQQQQPIEYKVTALKNCNGEPGERSQCPCKRPFDWSNCCIYCEICPHDYQCTCDDDMVEKKLICKHIHAVVRNFVVKQLKNALMQHGCAQGTIYSSSESEDSGSCEQ